jgi:hypothetical protein
MELSILMFSRIISLNYVVALIMSFHDLTINVLMDL